MVKAQEWLDQNYPQNGTCQRENDIYNNFGKKREQIKVLDIDNKNLEGTLDLTDFTNLEWLCCFNNNYLTQIIYPVNAEKLIHLDIRNNNFPTQDFTIFSKFRNLGKLEIGNYNKNNTGKGIYNHFTGSLEPLKDLGNLYSLNISNTDINTGLEYLPESLRYFSCLADYRKDAKCKDIYNLFANREGVIETDEYGYITNFPKKLREYKNLRILDYSETEIQQLVKLGLELSDYGFANFLKNGKNLTPEETENKLKELDKEFHYAQNWVDYNYSDKEKVNLKELNISNKNLWGDLDLREFKSLEILNCSKNEISSLNLRENVKLTNLICSNNQLTTINFENNTVITNLNITSNQLKELDLSKNIDLIELNCENNPELLSLKGGKSLKKLICSNGKLNQLDLSQCENLAELDCSNNKLTNLNLTNNLQLKELFCSNNQLVNITFSPDYESYKLGRINLTGNNKLDYVAIDKKFLKRLPEKLDYEIPAIDKQELEQTIVQKANIYGMFTVLWMLENEIKEKKNHLENLNKDLKTTKEAIEKISQEITENFPDLVEEKNDQQECSCQECQQEIEVNKSYWHNKTEDSKFCSRECYQKFKLEEVKSKRKENKKLPEEIKKTEKQISELEKQLEKKTKDKKEGKDITGIYPFSTWWNPNCALVVNKVVWYGIRLVVYEPAEKNLPKTLTTFKLSEHIYPNKVQTKLEELKEKLNSNNPILTLYSHNFSPEEVIKRTVLPKEAEQEPDKYLKPTDIVWRTMNIPFAHHVAVYLGNSRVVHIGSSKFTKTSGGLNPSNPSVASDASDAKALLGARNDHWLDFLYNTKQLTRYHSVIPFKKPEIIQENIANAILAEYGADNYKFLTNNCEHFATLCVYGIPFSTQADKISMLANKVHCDLAKEIKETEQKFAEMPNSIAYKWNIRRIKLREIKDLSQKELNLTEQDKLTSLEAEELRKELIKSITEELAELKDLESQTNLTQEQGEKLINLTKDLSELKEEKENDSDSEITPSLHSNNSTTSLSSGISTWEQRVNSHVPGTLVEITPLDNPNQALVINKVVLYAVRLFEYKDNKLKELKRYAKNKIGYTTLEAAQDKVRRIIEVEQAKQTTAYLEIPPK